MPNEQFATEAEIMKGLKEMEKMHSLTGLSTQENLDVVKKHPQQAESIIMLLASLQVAGQLNSETRNLVDSASKNAPQHMLVMANLLEGLTQIDVARNAQGDNKIMVPDIIMPLLKNPQHVEGIGEALDDFTSDRDINQDSGITRHVVKDLIATTIPAKVSDSPSAKFAKAQTASGQPGRDAGLDAGRSGPTAPRK